MTLTLSNPMVSSTPGSFLLQYLLYACVSHSVLTLCNPMDTWGPQQAPLSMEFFRQEYWSGLPYPSPGALPNPGLNLGLQNCRQILYCLSHQGKKESEVAKSCPTLCDPMDSSLHQAPASMGFSRQEYWNGLPFPSPGTLPNPGIEPRSLTL